jgi:hypothetical protein
VTTTTPPLSELRSHCAQWQPIETVVAENKCGPKKVRFRRSEKAADVYYDFCQELVDRKIILTDIGEEPRFGEEYSPTPGECERFVQHNKEGKLQDPLSLGVAFDRRGCSQKDQDGDKPQWGNGVNMTGYGLERCSAAFGEILFNGCGYVWTDCMRFTAVTRDEEHSAPETLPRRIVDH